MIKEVLDVMIELARGDDDGVRHHEMGFARTVADTMCSWTRRDRRVRSAKEFFANRRASAPGCSSARSWRIEGRGAGRSAKSICRIEQVILRSEHR